TALRRPVARRRTAAFRRLSTTCYHDDDSVVMPFCFHTWFRRLLLLVALAELTLPLAARQLQSAISTPDAHFGFPMGADGRLATSDQIEKYFEAVAAQSDRVKIIDIGATTEGHRTIAAIVSAPGNIRNLDRIRAANQRLSDPRTLSADDARQVVATHKA